MTTPKNALLIGASRGIGLGLAGEFLDRGWTLTATERTPSEGLAALRRDHPNRLTIERQDIREPSAPLAQRLAGQSFDLLFLNPGIMAGRNIPLGDVPDADINDIFLTNAIGPIRAADTLASLVPAGGMICFMSSVLGSVATNEDGRAELYRASKAALNSLIRSFCARHASSGHTVLALHPGVVRSGMGGPAAPLDIETSVTAVADVIAKRWGAYGTRGGHAFIDWRNQEIPW